MLGSGAARGSRPEPADRLIYVSYHTLNHAWAIGSMPLLQAKCRSKADGSWARGKRSCRPIASTSRKCLSDLADGLGARVTRLSRLLTCDREALSRAHRQNRSPSTDKATARTKTASVTDRAFPCGRRSGRWCLSTALEQGSQGRRPVRRQNVLPPEHACSLRHDTYRTLNHVCAIRRVCCGTKHSRRHGK